MRQVRRVHDVMSPAKREGMLCLHGAGWCRSGFAGVWDGHGMTSLADNERATAYQLM